MGKERVFIPVCERHCITLSPHCTTAPVPPSHVAPPTGESARRTPPFFDELLSRLGQVDLRVPVAWGGMSGPQQGAWRLAAQEAREKSEKDGKTWRVRE